MLQRNPLFQKMAGITMGAVAAILLFLGVSTGDQTPEHTASSPEPKPPSPTIWASGDHDRILSVWTEFVDRSMPVDDGGDEESSEHAASTEPPLPPPPPNLEHLVDEKPTQWGEVVRGVRTRLDTEDKKIALTLDACGGDYDEALLDFLRDHHIPATLFIAGYWLRRHKETLRQLADDPLFEIANHGLQHRPCSVTGRSVMEIEGTGSVGEAHREIEENARRLTELTGKRPQYYRSGTAYYDEICTAVAAEADHTVVGFDVVGDYGASFTPQQVRDALLEAQSGSIVVLHMNRPASGTAEGVRLALPLLQEHGFSFVHLSDFPLR